MNLKMFTTMINHAFNYVIMTSNKYNIDESHALKHSMEVLHFANKIYDSELYTNPFLEEQKDIIFVSSVLHDMCDKKYMNEQIGIQEMQNYMKDYLEVDHLDVVSDIISTMSYSKVMKQGYPELHEYQLAYHIVREADLLAAYDLDRCIIYQMMHDKCSYSESLPIAIQLFYKRVLRYIENDLFVTEYSKKKAAELHLKALEDIEKIKFIY
jgi:HD superfamily phosphodiesterase